MRFIFGVMAVFVFSLGFFALQPAGAQTNPYFPLESGLHCTFTSEMSGSPELYVTVTGTEQFYGQTVWAVQYNYAINMDYRIDFYSIGSDGDVFFHGLRTIGDLSEVVETVIEPPFCILDMPASPGKTWNNAYSWTNYIDGVLDDSLDGFMFMGEILDTASDVTVPAGSFTGIEVAGVSIHDSGLIPAAFSDYWFADGIGPVRRDSYTLADPEGYVEMMWSVPLAQEEQSWGSVKALFR